MKFKGGQSGGGSGLPYLKIKDGETIHGVFRGDPYEGYSNFQTKKWYPLEAGKQEGTSYRFRVNVIIKEGASYVAKVWEQGYERTKDIAKLMKEAKRYHQQDTLDNLVIAITRHGATKDDTSYELEIAEQQPGAATWKVINAVKLNDLSGNAPTTQGLSEPPMDDSPMPEGEYDADSIPF